jgi:hypothetical protein
VAALGESATRMSGLSAVNSWDVLTERGDDPKRGWVEIALNAGVAGFMLTHAPPPSCERSAPLTSGEMC